MLTMGSLFDGIGGWQLAAAHAGVRPVWSSEIEKFPCAVTKKHFPGTLQLGDITKIDGANLPPVDIVCAGSPCQDLSVAGKQEGLKGARSGLFRTAARLVRDMRRATGGRYPRFFVWENVPGAFSSNKGMDFRAVLEEIGEAELPMPEGGRWANAGLAKLPKCEIAWRVLDAQYWGVPQRRKRIFLVADFAERKRRAGEILFESESMFGHTAAGGEAREGTAAGVESGIGAAGGNCLTPWDVQSKRIYGDDGVFRCLQATTTNGEKPGCIAAGFKAGQSSAGGLGYGVEKAATLSAKHSGVEPTVAVYGMTHASEVMRPVKGGKVQTLNARMGTGGNQVPVVAYSIGNGQADQTRMSPIAGALNCMHDQQAMMVRAVDCRNLRETEKSATLQAKENGGYSLNYQNPVRTQNSVRRLTPLECERLQGLPDGYTLIDDKTCSNTARYKALGNGMAQPVANWVIKRIKDIGYDEKN